MSASPNATDAALEPSINVADEIEVAGDGTDFDFGLGQDQDLESDLPDPAGPGYTHHEEHQESHEPQGQSQTVQAEAQAQAQAQAPIHTHTDSISDDKDQQAIRRSLSPKGPPTDGHGIANGHRSPSGSPKSNDHEDGDFHHERKASEGGSSRHGQGTGPAPFPTHNEPRTWLLTQALSPLAIRLMRHLLAHGDYVVACLPPHEFADDERNAEFKDLISEYKSNRRDREGWKDRLKAVQCSGRSVGECSAVIAEAVHTFGHIDILLCCKSEAVVGTVEELSTRPGTQALVRDQTETILFSQINFIKAALPQLRSQRRGHIIALTSIGGHIGTPGMSMYTAATWGLEGFLDSIAYEIAPFDIRVTIVQPNKEVQTLTNKITFAPQLPSYEGSDDNPAPSIRDMLNNALSRNPETSVEPSDTDITHRYTRLPSSSYDKLVMETVHTLTAIGGLDNPPARHIVGFEGAEAVKEKLQIVTEELEDFLDASLAVDIYDSQLKAEAREGKARDPDPEHESELPETMDF